MEIIYRFLGNKIQYLQFCKNSSKNKYRWFKNKKDATNLSKDEIMRIWSDLIHNYREWNYHKEDAVVVF